jgi:hypothetical protein
VDYRNIGFYILDLTLRAKCDLMIVVVETETTFSGDRDEEAHKS